VAIETGRLTKSVKKNPGGTYSIDPKRADLEWAASTYADRVPLTGPTAPAAVLPAGPATAGAEAMSLGEARARLEAAKAELAEMDLEERRGELVPAREVEARLVAVFSSCKVKLLGVPSRVRQQDPGLTKAQVALIEASVREALEDLAGEPESEEATA
jgi:phage terminase Nu1 subunit (DNA packaging protein)